MKQLSSEANALGACMLGAVGVGIYKDVIEAEPTWYMLISGLNQFLRMLKPIRKCSEIFNDAFMI